MPIDVKLEDGFGDGYKCKVDPEGTLNVVAHDHPPRQQDRFSIPFVQSFTNSAGATDMRVDGSSTPVLFTVDALAGFDIYIKSISVVIADAGATLNEFGAITALTNGIEFCWDTQDLGNVQIGDNLKSNFDFIELAQGQPAFGSGASSFRANNVISTSEGFIPTIDLTRVSSQYGLRLRANTKDRLIFKINDNITTIDRFTAKAFGIKIGD